MPVVTDSSAGTMVSLESRKHNLRVVLVIAGFLIALVALLAFSGNAALLQDAIKWAAAGGMGWAGGYGWAKRRRG